MTRRHYSDADRAAALAVLAANDGNLTGTARETGIPFTTLKAWAAQPERAAPAEVRAEKAFDLVALFQAELDAVFVAMGAKRDRATYADLSRAAGIYTDKLMALQNNLPTQPVDITSGGKPIASLADALAVLDAAYRDADDR